MKRAALASVMVLTLLATSVAEAAMEGPSGDKEPTAGEVTTINFLPPTPP